MAAPKKSGLGRGLDALFGDVDISALTGGSPESDPADSKAGDSKSTKSPSGQTGKTSTAGKTGKKTSTAQSSSKQAASKGASGQTGKTRASGSKAKEENGPDTAGEVFLIDINDIKPNENQPRKAFNEEKIEELAASILENGMIQPIVVRKKKGYYEIVAGERRYRAARKAKLPKLPCIVKELTDEQNMLLSIIENMQREDLNPVEEAEAINKMIELYGLTQEQVSKSLSKSRPYITNSLRLLKLPEKIRDMLIDGRLSPGHARALITISDERRQLELAERAASGGLSVRELERLSGEAVSRKRNVKKAAKSPDTIAVEEELKQALGTKVNIVDKGKAGGRIEIECYSREELERIIELLTDPVIHR